MDAQILKKYPSRNPDAAWRVIDGEAVIVMPSQSLVRVFNETGARIWGLSDGTLAAGSIADAIAAEWGVELPEARQDVDTFLAECASKGLISLHDEPRD